MCLLLDKGCCFFHDWNILRTPTVIRMKRKKGLLEEDDIYIYYELTLTTASSRAFRSFSLNGRQRTTTRILLLLTHWGLDSWFTLLAIGSECWCIDVLLLSL